MKIKIPFFKQTGKAGEPVELEVNQKNSPKDAVLISQALHVEDNHQMVKPGLVKTKANVSGGGRKPWKQKGTGRARAGSNRSPLWRGGGITFGPTKLSKDLNLPSKMRARSFALLFVDKAKDKNLAIIEKLDVESNKTKDALGVLRNANMIENIILAIDTSERESTLAWRNLPMVEIKDKNDITLTDLSSLKTLLLTSKAFDKVKQKIR